MKTAMNKTPPENAKTNIHKTKPGIRDNLDSRANEEQDFRGDDITRNRKPHHNVKPGKK